MIMPRKKAPEQLEEFIEKQVMPTVERTIKQNRWNGICDDIRQQTYLHLIASFRIDTADDVVAYIAKSARNAAIDIARQERRWRKHLVPLESLRHEDYIWVNMIEDKRVDSDTQEKNHQEIQKLEEKMIYLLDNSGLTKREKAVIMLRYYEGHTQREVGEILNIAGSTVSSAEKKGKEKLGPLAMVMHLNEY